MPKDEPTRNKKTIAQIREELKGAVHEELEPLARHYALDERKQVREMAERALKRHAKEEAERERVREMYRLMDELSEGALAVGVDEVGRGPVAGPLTVCAVALPPEPIIWGLNDSKKLTPERREELAAQILQTATAVGIAHIEPAEIDACGMAASLRVAMRRAIADTGLDPQAVLVDGVPVHIHPGEVAVVHGDARVANIAAASIVAKVTRDAIMVAADEMYPGYSFAQAKGYASAEHIAAIKQRGLTPYHRASFCQNFLADAHGEA